MSRVPDSPLPQYFFRPVDQETCDHEWEDNVSICAQNDGEGYLVLTCKKCGYLKRIEDT